MAEPTYSLASDFGGSINERQFHSEVIAESGIIKTLVGVHHTGDVITIEFTEALPAEEKTTLDGLTAAHIANTIPELLNKKILTPIKVCSKCPDYYRTYSFVFPGGSHGNLKIHSYMDSGITSYDIRIFDCMSRLVLGTANYTNTSETQNNIGVLTNVSSTETIVEIHLRKNGGTSDKAVHSLTALLEYI